MKRLVEILATGVLDNAGSLLASGQVYSYEPGTSKKTPLYSDYDCTEELDNPATLNSTGKLIAYAPSRVDLALYTSAGKPVRRVQNVGTADIDVDPISAIAGDAITRNSTTGKISVAVDGASLGFIDGDLALRAAGLVAAKFQASSVTAAKKSARNIEVSSNSISPTNPNTTSEIEIDSIEITTSGRPVLVGLIADETSNASEIKKANILFYRDGTLLCIYPRGGSAMSSNGRPTSSYKFCEKPAAGTYTYKISAAFNSSGQALTRVKAYAMEL